MNYKPYKPREFRSLSNTIELDKVTIDEAISILQKEKKENPDCVVSTSVCEIELFSKNKHYETQKERYESDLITYHKECIKELNG